MSKKITESLDSQQGLSDDFELHAKVPGMGEVNLKLYQEAWNKASQFLKGNGWWMFSALLLSAIGVQNNVVSHLKPFVLPTTQVERPQTNR